MSSFKVLFFAAALAMSLTAVSEANASGRECALQIGVHRVVPGEAASLVAKRHSMSFRVFLNLNPKVQKDPRKWIYIGQLLRVWVCGPQRYLQRRESARALKTARENLRGAASRSERFEDVFRYAIAAEQITGVRADLVLAVIARESNFGRNVGTGNWRRDLAHPNCWKQQEAFRIVTARLGFNPDYAPVSKRAWYGSCGGAMGHAQIMPATWLQYESRIVRITGKRFANPWDMGDAIVASALLLGEYGAGARTYRAEYTAALKYFAGQYWQRPLYRSYGDGVMASARQMTAYRVRLVASALRAAEKL